MEFERHNSFKEFILMIEQSKSIFFNRNTFYEAEPKFDLFKFMFGFKSNLVFELFSSNYIFCELQLTPLKHVNKKLFNTNSRFCSYFIQIVT